MTLARTHSVALVGVEGHLVECEADIANGLVGMVLVGLPDTALREARDRIRSAIINSGEQWPQRRITVGLSPASLPKRGSGFDLPIACALLAAAGGLSVAGLGGALFLCGLGAGAPRHGQGAGVGPGPAGGPPPSPPRAPPRPPRGASRRGSGRRGAD